MSHKIKRRRKPEVSKAKLSIFKTMLRQRKNKEGILPKIDLVHSIYQLQVTMTHLEHKVLKLEIKELITRV